jgi:hypothetical protein
MKKPTDLSRAPTQPPVPRVRFTRAKFTSFFSEGQAGRRNPSTEDIADAARMLTVILN